MAAAPVRGQDIDDFVTGWIDKRHVPAVTIAVVKGGALLKAEGYGLADVENRISARPDTVFKIGSLSKQFIATGVMLLVQDGRIAVDDKVSRHLEGTPKTWEAITLRHLLTHTSGLVREAPGFDVYKLSPTSMSSRRRIRLRSRPLPAMCTTTRTSATSCWRRSPPRSAENRGVSSSANAFRPLGMTATRVTSLTDLVPNRASGYAWTKGELQNEDDWPAVRPSGAFLSTVLDLAKWEGALSRDQILNEPTKREMWTPVRLNDGRTFPYGFGWQLDEWPADSKIPTGIPMIRHGGAMNGFRAGYVRWPSHRLTVIVLTNLSNAPYEGLVANIGIRYAPELRVQQKGP